MTKAKALKRAAKKADKRLFGRKGGGKQGKWADIGVAGGGREKNPLVDW